MTLLCIYIWNLHFLVRSSPWQFVIEVTRLKPSFPRAELSALWNRTIFWLNDLKPFSMILWASLVAQRLKRLPGIRETRVQSLGREDPLEKEMATHSSILAWRIPWREEPGRLQSMGRKESDTTERLQWIKWFLHFIHGFNMLRLCFFHKLPDLMCFLNKAVASFSSSLPLIVVFWTSTAVRSYLKDFLRFQPTLYRVRILTWHLSLGAWWMLNLSFCLDEMLRRCCKMDHPNRLWKQVPCVDFFP